MSALVKIRGAPQHFWCEHCDATRSVAYRDLDGLDITRQFVGGDIVCQTCNSLLATYGFPVETNGAPERLGAGPDDRF